MTPGGAAISLFARHPTAANLLMVLMIVAGLFSLSRQNTQFFPDIGIDVIQISVTWPGASAEDIDANIVAVIEPEVRFIDGVKEVRSISIEGVAQVFMEFDPGSDMQAALANVETAVGQVTTLPEDSETPIINRFARYDNITRVVLSGPYTEGALKAFAKRIRDDLLARGIDKVDLVGVRDEEVWVEIDPVTLRRIDLTLGDVARRIAEVSQDLPSGDTRGPSELQIRSLGLVKDASEIAGVEIRSLPDGEKLYLRDIATVSDRFAEGGVTLLRNGQPAVELFIQRAVNADALEVGNVVTGYIAEAREWLPANLTIEEYDVAVNLIRGRIFLLLKNGLGGLILVIAILFVFLNGRVAFWVAVGIPISLLATMAMMHASGQSINMVSLFGLIMALGIVVDDAIVVGEHAEARHRGGMSPLEAAETGAKRMAAPVLSSSLTTIAAFMPLFVISDVIGQIILAIPLVAVAVILASLVECFLVLPGHLRGALSHSGKGPSRPRRWFNRHFDAFRDGLFARTVALCLRWRYTTVASALGILILCIGLVIGGRVGFVFFPAPEVDRIYADLKLVAGSPREQTEAMLAEIERAAHAAAARFPEEAELIHMSLVKVGDQFIRGQLARVSDQFGGVVVELKPTDVRTVTAAEFAAAWREEVHRLAGVEDLTIRPAMAGPPGRDIDIRLSGDDPVRLKQAAAEVRDLLASYPGVSDLGDDLAWGKQEVILEVNARGRALGFTTESVGRQVRDAFEGAVAKRFPRGDEEVLVRVQYPREAADAAALDALYLRAPGGAEVALSEVVDRRETRGFALIKREDGVREVAVTGEIDKAVTNGDAVHAALVRDGVHAIAERYGARASFAGRAEEQQRTIGDMRVGAMLGLAAIYIILAWVFASYTRPFVVMVVIPLGFVGATVGHFALGYDLTILSLVALVGLSGIVVNDSIILVSTIDERIGNGEPLHEAIMAGSRDRLRAVILTSATTIGGLTPLIFERSLQAQFLIPMALTIVFGLMVATLLVLLVVPAVLAIQGDLAWIFRRRRPAPRAAGADQPRGAEPINR